jgi:hypothetical protein
MQPVSEESDDIIENIEAITEEEDKKKTRRKQMISARICLIQL